MNRKGRLRVLLTLNSRRSLARRKSQTTCFDATPMGDLSFLLFIFFIVTSSFILRQGIFFSLPSPAGGVVRIDPSRAVEVYPVERGFMVDSHLLSRAEFAEKLRTSLDDKRERVLIVHMAPSVLYDRFVDTLSAARETGWKRISLHNMDGN